MMQNCYQIVVDGAACVHCDEVVGVPGVAEQRYEDPIFGWNASARSVASQANDCYVEFDQPFVIGAALGFAEQHVDSNPAQLQHAFYFFESAGANWWAVLENGALQTAQTKRSDASESFRIERIGARVRYYVNGKCVHDSSAAHTRPLIVVACLYASNDGVG